MIIGTDVFDVVEVRVSQSRELDCPSGNFHIRRIEVVGRDGNRFALRVMSNQPLTQEPAEPGLKSDGMPAETVFRFVPD